MGMPIMRQTISIALQDFCTNHSCGINLAGDKKQALRQRHAHGTKLPAS
jgi:hypothetical protein